MRLFKLLFRGILTIITLISITGCSSPEPTSIDLDETTIRNTVLGLENEMNLAVDNLDCDGGLVALGTREPIFVSNGNVVRTDQKMREQCKDMVTRRSGAEFDADSITANVLSNDIAYVVREGYYTIYRADTSNTSYLVMTSIWHRQPDGWKMVHLHESSRRN